MRKKLIKLLRELEENSDFYNEYAEPFGEHGYEYSIKDYLDFPSYKSVIHRFHKKYIDYGFDSSTSDSSIKAELKRMEVDNLITIGIQEGVRFSNGDINKGTPFSCERDKWGQPPFILEEINGVSHHLY